VLTFLVLTFLGGDLQEEPSAVLVAELLNALETEEGGFEAEELSLGRATLRERESPTALNQGGAVLVASLRS
jgi:hypothetical protein